MRSETERECFLPSTLGKTEICILKLLLLFKIVFFFHLNLWKDNGTSQVLNAWPPLLLHPRGSSWLFHIFKTKSLAVAIY